LKIGVPTVAQPTDVNNSRGITEYQYLPPLQKQIVLYLAENPPQIRFRISKGIKGYYKSVCKAIKDLLGKKIVVETEKRKYTDDDSTDYWLTPAGVFVALVQGANPKTVLKRTIEVYPDNKMLQCFVELTTILGTDIHRVGYEAVLKKGKLEKRDVSQMLGTGLMKDLSLEKLLELIALMKKYPEQFSGFKEQIVEIMEKIKKTELFLKDALEKS
jgi:hypothetical protein